MKNARVNPGTGIAMLSRGKSRSKAPGLRKAEPAQLSKRELNPQTDHTLLGYKQPSLDDLFDGAKVKWGKEFNKYMASTQVPHSVNRADYYDGQADALKAKEYYGNVASLSGQERKDALQELVTQSHTPEPKGYRFTVAKHLYTTVDRHPDGTVRDVYSTKPVEQFQYPDISLEKLSEKELSYFAGALTSSPEVISSWLGFQSGNAKLNCEHVVPQSYFQKQEPMKSDLHHLYASDMKTNSKRGNTKYGQFQPVEGRGEVARATLYFLLRYPKIETPYTSTDIEMLKQWSNEDPPGLHEKHRNREIQKIQGNRNPFIDHPDWLADTPLSGGPEPLQA